MISLVQLTRPFFTRDDMIPLISLPENGAISCNHPQFGSSMPRLNASMDCCSFGVIFIGARLLKRSTTIPVCPLLAGYLFMPPLVMVMETIGSGL